MKLTRYKSCPSCGKEIKADVICIILRPRRFKCSYCDATLFMDNPNAPPAGTLNAAGGGLLYLSTPRYYVDTLLVLLLMIYGISIVFDLFFRPIYQVPKTTSKKTIAYGSKKHEEDE